MECLSFISHLTAHSDPIHRLDISSVNRPLHLTHTPLWDSNQQVPFNSSLHRSFLCRPTQRPMHAPFSHMQHARSLYSRRTPDVTVTGSIFGASCGRVRSVRAIALHTAVHIRSSATTRRKRARSHEIHTLTYIQLRLFFFVSSYCIRPFLIMMYMDVLTASAGVPPQSPSCPLSAVVTGE